MTATNTSLLFRVGSALGKGAAHAVHGTALGSTHLAQGMRTGYASKAEELKAKRLALLAEIRSEAVVEPVVVKQRRVRA